jgi:hypothetical protein
MSDTPRVDHEAFTQSPEWGHVVDADFARGMERELAAVTAERDRLRERARRLEEAGDKMVEAYSCDALNAWEKAKESHP